MFARPNRKPKMGPISRGVGSGGKPPLRASTADPDHKSYTEHQCPWHRPLRRQPEIKVHH
jgi:hypothetical protein